MKRIVAVHGIAQQFHGEDVLIASWLPALRSGLRRVGATLDDERDLAIAFFGDLFRSKGQKAVLPNYSAEDVIDPFERELLAVWAEAAAQDDPEIQTLDDCGKARTPAAVQRALDILLHSKFFAALGERALIGNLKQVRQYMTDPAMRAKIYARVAAQVGPETRVVIGHSLGSIIAYEFLAAHPELEVRMLLTLGSPLGIRNLVFDRLVPAPRNGVGAWPGTVGHWTNIADGGDIVALNKTLSALFGSRVVDHLIYNGSTAHDISPYLTTEEAGHALRVGLEG